MMRINHNSLLSFASPFASLRETLFLLFLINLEPAYARRGGFNRQNVDRMRAGRALMPAGDGHHGRYFNGEAHQPSSPLALEPQPRMGREVEHIAMFFVAPPGGDTRRQMRVE